MESRWSESPLWRPILHRSREAVETLARDMRAAEQRRDSVPPSAIDAKPERPATKKRSRRRRATKPARKS